MPKDKKPVRVLENGIKILREKIRDDGPGFTLELILERPYEEFTDFSELAEPGKNGIIFEKLVSKGWVDQNNTTKIAFDFAYSSDTAKKRVLIVYGMRNPSL